MAEEKDTAAQQEETGQKGESLLMGFILPLVLVVLLAAGAGAGLGFMLAPQFGKAAAAHKDNDGKGEAAAAPEAPDAGDERKAGAEHGGGKDKKDDGKPHEPAGAARHAALYKGQGELIRLKPVTTNLRKPFRAWVRLEGALIIVRDEKAGEGEKEEEKEKEAKGKKGGEEAPAPEGGLAPLMALVEEEVHAYLRTLSLKDLEGAANLAFLRDDLTERAATRTNGLAREFVILSLVVEE
jgi:hypothetical protein